jgi:condensin complex subunit 3
MPARTAASSTSTARKVSGQTIASRRASSVTPSVAAPEEQALPTTSPHLRADICAIFADTQRSTTGHRKLVVRLRKIQEHCCGIIPKKAKKDGKQDEEDGNIRGSEETLAEKEFNLEISRCLLRVLPIKKTEPVGDRIIRFVGLFLSHASEKGEYTFIQ